MRILYFAPLYYDDMKQRPQQIAECLSARHEVFYVEPTISLIRWLLWEEGLFGEAGKGWAVSCTFCALTERLRSIKV